MLIILLLVDSRFPPPPSTDLVYHSCLDLIKRTGNCSDPPGRQPAAAPAASPGVAPSPPARAAQPANHPADQPAPSQRNQTQINSVDHNLNIKKTSETKNIIIIFFY